MRFFLFGILLFSSTLSAQVGLQVEARFRGLARCPSLVLWSHARHWEVWSRSEFYPSSAINSDDFPAIRSAFGNTTLVGFGFSEMKLIAGFQNGEFIKGIHMSSASDDDRFWYNVFMIHKPPLGQDEFRLDGEMDFQGFSKPLSKGSNRRSRVNTVNSMGGMVRLECYEPVPLVIHSGIAFRRLTDKGKPTNASHARRSDFNRVLDGKRRLEEPRSSSTTVFTLIVGPSYFFSRDWGANVVLKWTL